MSFMQQIYEQARNAQAHIILAERDSRVEEAAHLIEEQGLAKITILENLTDAATKVAAGEADGYVGGNLSSTSDTIRSGLKHIGTTGFASSYFIMLHGPTPLFFADCAFNINPNAEQLAQIAVQTAKSAITYGITPKVAFLSYSTKGSAAGTETIQQAVELARTMAPDIVFEGELQFDAAFVPEVAAQKAPDAHIHGDANVFIFPDLNSGNIGYKIAQRMGGCTAIGPILQGFKKPVNDLSRGCSTQDIVDVVAITAVQTRNL